MAEFIELNERSAYVASAYIISDVSGLMRNAMRPGNDGWAKPNSSVALVYNVGRVHGEELQKRIRELCETGQLDDDILFGQLNDRGITFKVHPRIIDEVNVLNMQRLTEWYNHMMSACSTIILPIRKKTGISVWTTKRMSPDVIAKNVRKVKFKKTKGNWVSWLNG